MLECPQCGRIFDDECQSCNVDGSRLRQLFPGSPLLGGTYALQRRIEAGGMGVIARAEHRGLRRTVAVKMLRPEFALDQRARRRLRAEAEALGRLDHPNIVRVTDYGFEQRSGGMPYLVMELIEGVSLRTLLEGSTGLDMERGIEILAGVASALDAAHDAGVIHGDLKPDNVLLAESDDSKSDHVKVLDFGLARLFGAFGDDDDPMEAGAKLKPGEWTGTPAYMAPELFKGHAAHQRSDIYALSVLAFELLAGRRPFEGRGNDLVVAQMSSTPPAPSSLNSTLPPELDAPILSGLAKRPEDRPTSAGELIAELRIASLSAKQRLWRQRELPRRRRLALAATLVAATTALALAGAGALERLDVRSVAVRFDLASPRAPDSRLLLVVLDDESLDADPTPLIERADELAGHLNALFDAGAAAIGIDILLPPGFAESESLTRVVVERADQLVLALTRTSEGAFVGDEMLHGAVTSALGGERSARLLGLVNLDAGKLTVMTEFQQTDGGSMPSFAAALARADGINTDNGSRRRWIDLRVPASALPRISWKDVREVCTHAPQTIEGRVVVIGLGFAGVGDVFRSLPGPSGAPRRVSGFELQGLATNTLLGSPAIHNVPPVAGGLVVLLTAAFSSIATFLLLRPGVITVVLACAAIAYAVISAVLFSKIGLVLPCPSVAAACLTVVTFSLISLPRTTPYPRS